jgi:effector-binding domain-containing protein
LDWEDIFKIVTAVLGSVGSASIIIFGFSSWLGKVWASRILTREKAKLDTLSYEHQVKFSSLHEKRADVIAETYALVRDVYNRVAEFSSHNGNTQENRDRVGVSIKNLTDYYPKRRIFISYEVANKIDRLRVELSRIVEDVDTAGSDYDSTSMYERIYESASEALSNLEEDFRVLLGEDLTRKSSGLVNSPLI